MAVFRRLVLVALCAGLLSGIFATAAHQLSTVPVILKAEMYEKAAEHQPASVHAHEHSAMWEPENGAERTAYTLIADVLTGIGFALLLAAGLTLRGGEVTWREGSSGVWEDLRPLPSRPASAFRRRCPAAKPHRSSSVKSGGLLPPFRPAARSRCFRSPGERLGRSSLRSLSYCPTSTGRLRRWITAPGHLRASLVNSSWRSRP